MNTPPDPGTLRAKLSAWFAAHGRQLPWRDDISAYAVLVSEFMLQQTQVVSVIPYFQKWMSRFPTVRELAEAPEEAVLQLWQGLGYYSRARNLHKAARAVVERFGGAVPGDPAQLATLPGVGPYSAGAIAAFAFDKPVPAVDANIARVLARLFNIQTPVDSPAGNRLIWERASAMLPAAGGGRLHTSSLMELGALVCTAKNPKCLVCPLREDCRATDPETLPRKAPRKTTVRLQENAGWSVSEGLLLLEQQTGRRAGGLWKLPMLENAPEDVPPLFETVYPFTHHRITLRVYPSPAPTVSNPAQRWFALDSVLDEAPLPAGHRRALLALIAART